VVYATPPFGGPPGALEYLGRYTHRVTISGHRLLSLTGDEIIFPRKDYRGEPTATAGKNWTTAAASWPPG
jgi:hypothetical protein